MRVLLVPDKAGWSVERIAMDLVHHNPDTSLSLDVLPLKGNVKDFIAREKSYDRVLMMTFQQLDLLPWYKSVDRKRWLVGVHSAHSFDPELRTTPDADVDPPAWLLKTLKQSRGVNVVSRRLFDLFDHRGLNLWCTQNGTDVNLFRPLRPLSTSGKLRVGFAGTAKGIHDRRKGYSEFVEPACRLAGVDLMSAVARTGTHLPPDRMAEFYNSIDILLLPSSSEGFSLAVLEAAACGRVVISTRVGGSTELIRDGENGFLVDRTVEAIADRLTWIRDHRESAALMGKRMRQNVVENWSWEKRAPAWLKFLTT